VLRLGPKKEKDDTSQHRLFTQKKFLISGAR
jgi:hypothetical protein